MCEEGAVGRIETPTPAERPRLHSSFRVRSSVKVLATDALEEPLLPHRGGSKINKASPEEGEKRLIDPSERGGLREARCLTALKHQLKPSLQREVRRLEAALTP
ncbi:unnamed protein product [Pleuronectes platessa]|uniref:Uncharacterized protein n=1 Tax=Pleuronectes platessa TaxID=8262 RepID=A0A9N7VEK8_PLEPL|nr:unnamed protein product [Pleuronectes platessa]